MAGFFVPCPGITWREREQQRQPEQQQRQPEQQQRQREQQRQQREQQRQREQQLPEPEPELQRQALQREQQLLLSCRKRSWKQPAEQPGGWNISFDFPLLTNIKTHTRDRSGT